jgi:quercetin dioxygenase-like cupin family protein
MAGYTHLNLKDVEDMAPKFGYSPGLESRFARSALDCEKSGMTYYKVAPGFRVPFGHRHAEQEEIYVIISGSARIKVEDEVIDLATLDAIRLAPETLRALEGGPDGAEVIAFGAPQPAEQDAEMLQGWWAE